MKKENLVVRAKQEVEFYQIGSTNTKTLTSSMVKQIVKKNVIFLASSASRKYFPEDKFEIIDSVELKEEYSNCCPCCVSDCSFFKVSNYPDIIHINNLPETQKNSWYPIHQIENMEEPILRGFDMIEANR